MFHFIKIIKSVFYQIYKDIYFSINFVCKMRKYSVIIPAYNRPDEVGELLESLKSQPFMDFEIIVVEDGSTLTCRDVVIAAGGVDADAVIISLPDRMPSRARMLISDIITSPTVVRDRQGTTVLRVPGANTCSYSIPT